MHLLICYTHLFLRQHYWGEGQTGIHKYGTLEFKLPGYPFVTKNDAESATTGKEFVCQLLDKMYSLGYDFVVSSDLTRETDQVIILGKNVWVEENLTPHYYLVCTRVKSLCELTKISPHTGSDQFSIQKTRAISNFSSQG